MHCPFCSHEETKVIDSRLAGEGLQVRRRRHISLGEGESQFSARRLAEFAHPAKVRILPHLVVQHLEDTVASVA